MVFYATRYNVYDAIIQVLVFRINVYNKGFIVRLYDDICF